MLDLIWGLPVHPLVVHGVVILGPLAGIALLTYVFRPTWRAGLRWPLIACAAVAGTAAYVAKESGEKLEHRVGDPAAGHAEWGDRAFLACAALLLVTLVVVFVLAKALPRTSETGRSDSGAVQIAATVLAVLSAGAVWFTVFQAGHTGATSVWKDRVSNSAPADSHD